MGILLGLIVVFVAVIFVLMMAMQDLQRKFDLITLILSLLLLGFEFMIGIKILEIVLK